MGASRRASWRGSKLQVVRLRLQVLRLRLRRRSGSGSGGEMSRPGPAALLTLKGRMANSAGDNSVPGTIAAAEAVCAAAPPRCSRNAPLTLLVAPAEPATSVLPLRHVSSEQATAASSRQGAYSRLSRR